MKPGMKIRKFAAIPLLMLVSFVALGKPPPKSQLESMYDKAFTAFDTANYDEALRALDAIDRRQPDLAESFNLRGVILMRQGKYDQAEAALRKARSIEPKFWNASFNLAEIPFLKKDWVEARNRFEALMTSESGGMEAETSQLIQYKILLTFVLEGKEKTVDALHEAVAEAFRYWAHNDEVLGARFPQWHAFGDLCVMLLEMK